MPSYFIDLHDGTKAVRDAEGQELLNLDAARAHAVCVLTQFAHSFSDEPGRQDFIAAVRDAAGAVRLRLRMSLDADFIGVGRDALKDDDVKVAAHLPVWVSKPLKLHCFLIAIEHRRGTAPVYAVLASTADEALDAVAAAVAPRSKLREVGRLSRSLARQLRLKPDEVRLI
ncbi:hypothetical protein [Methylobacterium sp. C1]|uniref:DUF6894 family protein n=1 Tax=Methylobacterium sp. C1 TaxID=1479019 RepID=UPI001FD9ADC5|nr:hypothetical protein [Methylobacterium sp. C1]